MDEVLREALVVPDPDAVFGPPRPLMEYRGGELVVNGVPPTDDKGDDRPPPADAPLEQPGAGGSFSGGGVTPLGDRRYLRSMNSGPVAQRESTWPTTRG